MDNIHGACALPSRGSAAFAPGSLAGTFLFVASWPLLPSGYALVSEGG
jgi:hypothetical protein